MDPGQEPQQHQQQVLLPHEKLLHGADFQWPVLALRARGEAAQLVSSALSPIAQSWQTSLRNEAQQRLGGLRTPLQLTSGMHRSQSAEQLSANSRSSSKQQQWWLRSTSPGAQDDPFTARELSGNRAMGQQLGMDSRGDAGSSDVDTQGEGQQDAFSMGPWPPAFVSTSQYAQAHASALQAMARRPIGLLPATEQQEVEDEEEPRGSWPGTFGRSHHHATSTPGHQTLVERGRHGMRRVPTAPTFQELSDSWNAVLQTAQASIQATATNCQANLATLSNIFQQNLNGPAGPLQTALSNSRAMVTWSITNGGDPLGGVLVPWQVFPRVLRARELDAQGLLTAGSADGTESGGDSTRSSSNGIVDWVSPLEQYMMQLDGRKRHGQQQHRSIKEPGRQVAIVTTASLPWMTGTSVNPLLRAAYLASDGARKVTLVLPWLSPADQARVFPHNMHFDTPEQQEEYVRNWARQRTGLECNFKVTFYPGRYAAEKGSILPVGDITSVIPDHEADVAVLEEPEHLNWYHHGTRWTDKFNHVVGVMHTNYLDYARREENGPVKEVLLKHINAWMCRIYCHKVIKLSDAVQSLPRQDTMFVHGVSPAFLRVGEAKAKAAAESEEGEPVWGKGAYFLGKVLWAKGYTELLDRLNEHTARTGQHVHVDVYGSGPDLKAVEEEASRRHLALQFNGARDHADASLQDYKVFINPSLSDVVATTTAEALAMGKWAVCADHPSNRFFERFPNCLIYRNSEEFTQCLERALREDPKPLTPDQLHSLTWEAATERFLDVADIQKDASPLEATVDNLLASLHNTLTGVEFLRVVAGAGAKTRDMPARITDYQPDEKDVGGFFDNTHRAKRSWEGKKANKTAAPSTQVSQAMEPAAATAKA